MGETEINLTRVILTPIKRYKSNLNDREETPFVQPQNLTSHPAWRHLFLVTLLGAASARLRFRLLFFLETRTIKKQIRNENNHLRQKRVMPAQNKEAASPTVINHPQQSETTLTHSGRQAGRHSPPAAAGPYAPPPPPWPPPPPPQT